MSRSKKGNSEDLGSSEISRRDFLNGVLLSAGGLAVSQSIPMRAFAVGQEKRPPKGDTCDGSIGQDPRALRGGNLPAAFKVAHWLRDRRLTFGRDFVKLAPGCDRLEGKFPIHEDSAKYDVIITGSGLAGLSTAFYLLRRRPGTRILILDANQQFGGNASRDDQPPLPIMATTGGCYAVAPYEDFQRELYGQVGIEWEKHKLKDPIKCFYFDDRTPGVNKGYRGWNLDSYGEGVKTLPYSPAIVEQLIRCKADFKAWNTTDGSPSAPADHSDPKFDYLAGMSLHDYFVKNKGYDPLVSDFYNRYTIDALTGTNEQVNAHSGIDFLSSEYGPLFALPGGTSAFARHLVHWLIKDSIAGKNTQEILTNPIREEKLDDPEQKVRIRQNTVVMRADQSGAGAHSKASVIYHRDGEFFRVSAQAIVLAGQSYTAKHLVGHMHDKPREEAWKQFKQAPALVANVAIKSAAPLVDLGLGYDQYYWGSKYWADFIPAGWTTDPVTKKDQPTVLTFFAGNTAPPDQLPEERMKLLSTPFGDYEKSIKEDISRVFSGTKFDFDRDVTSISIYRWGHGLLMPTPGFTFGPPQSSEGKVTRTPGPRRIASAQLGRISFAGQDTEGTPAVESAMSSGLRAAQEVLPLLV